MSAQDFLNIDDHLKTGETLADDDIIALVTNPEDSEDDDEEEEFMLEPRHVPSLT